MTISRQYQDHPEGFWLNGKRMIPHALGGMYVPHIEALVVSDLHFEKGSFYAKGGQFLPPYDTRTTLRHLTNLIGLFDPRIVISLGDAFHDLGAEERMADEDAECLEAICGSMDVFWVLGNHDPLPPKRFHGHAEATIEAGGLVLTHEPTSGGHWHLAGHLHPAAIVAHGGRRQRRRCFVHDGNRLVMPAFGAFTGGLNILDTAFAGIMANDRLPVICGDRRTYRAPLAALRADRARPQPINRRMVG